MTSFSNVTIVTPMRDCAPILEQYRSRLETLDYPAERLRFVVCEGDSQDDTLALLNRWAMADRRVTVVTKTTGKPRYGSVVHPERFEVLATVFNAALAAVDLDWTDSVLFLPADILYHSDLLRRLLPLIETPGVDIVAPFVWMNGQFYDTWGFTRGGASFAPFRVHIAETFKPGPVAMETVGGTVLIRGDVLRAGARYTVEEVDRGFCKQAAALGFGVWADPCTDVFHPRQE